MDFSLEKYLSKGIETLVKDAVRVSFKSPKQIAFFMRYKSASKKAAQRRSEFEENGKHIPPFLIASITGDCNLTCTGCYSHANAPCVESQELPVAVWERIFCEAADIGVSVILIAGGEPLLRRDVIETATRHEDIIFPVFTNGTMFDDMTIKMFDTHRNLIPVVSIEGDEITTDHRRGEGVYAKAIEAMHRLRKHMILFGASITVTSENLDKVTENSFVRELKQEGCKLVLFVEYVPVEKPDIALCDEIREKMAACIDQLRAENKDMIILSFPGDEAESGGCLAAGRGFFHISASGNAEPCPFSPYSDLNLRDIPLIEALDSPLFTRLREDGILATPHKGGCVLFEQEEAVAKLAGKQADL